MSLGPLALVHIIAHFSFLVLLSFVVIIGWSLGQRSFCQDWVLGPYIYGHPPSFVHTVHYRVSCLVLSLSLTCCDRALSPSLSLFASAPISHGIRASLSAHSTSPTPPRRRFFARAPFPPFEAPLFSRSPPSLHRDLLWPPEGVIRPFFMLHLARLYGERGFHFLPAENFSALERGTWRFAEAFRLRFLHRHIGRFVAAFSATLWRSLSRAKQPIGLCFCFSYAGTTFRHLPTSFGRLFGGSRLLIS